MTSLTDQPVPSGVSDALVVEYSLLDRQRRDTQSWRRAFFATCLFTLGLLAIVLVLATKDHTTALVYKEDGRGDLALMGLAGSRPMPSELAVKHALAGYITDFRTIPGNDPDLVQQNFASLLAMTARDSQAFNDTQARVKTENPLDLGKKGYQRTVTRTEVNRLSDLTYRIAWTEAVRRCPDSPPVSRDYSGTVTLAQRPSPPTDPLIGQLNPAGIYVSSYDMAWSTISE